MYTIYAEAKTADEQVMAKTDTANPPTVNVVPNELSHASVTLSRLEHYTVSFDCNNDSDIDIPSQEVTAEYTATAPASSPTWAGHTFSFWGLSADATSGFNFDTPINAPTTLYAIWDTTVYNVTFHNNDGTAASAVVRTRENSSPESGSVPSPTRTGYTFKGWGTAANTAVASAIQSTALPHVNGDTAYYAVWEADTYTITYTVTPATVGSDWTTSYTVESASITLPTPTYTGLTFGRWYENSGFTGDAVTVILAGSTGHKEYYAKWTVPVTFNKNDASATGTMAVQNVVYGVETALIANAFGRGTVATFSKWNTAADGTGTDYTDGANITVSDAAGVTLYAIWNVTEPGMKYGPDINEVIKGYNSSGDSNKTFEYSATPPAAETATQNLADSGSDVLCWLDGNTIKFYSEWLAGDSSRKLKLNADSSQMFYNCDNLTSIELSKFDTSSVTNMNSMFSGCSSLTSLDVSGFNTSNVTKMMFTFNKCAKLTTLNVSSFDTSKVVDMQQMFGSCSELVTITVRAGTDWSNRPAGSPSLSSSAMFEGCTKLKGGRGTVYADANTRATYAKVDGGTSSPGYFTAAP